MKELFFDYKIEVNEKQIEKFEKYYDLLYFYNQKFNITAITEKKEVYIKHFIDSALGLKLISGKKLIDVGSGGGFPSIPLKILNENMEITAVEATGKKCEFINTVINELNLENCKVINKRAEELAFDNNFREKFDCVVSRAVARYNVLAEYCMPFIKIGGKFIAYKGDYKEELEEGCSAINILGGKIEKVEDYTLDKAKRGIIVVNKIKATGNNYPRKNGVIKKKPL